LPGEAAVTTVLFWSRATLAKDSQTQYIDGQDSARQMLSSCK